MKLLSSSNARTELFYTGGPYTGPKPLGIGNLASDKYKAPTNFIDPDTIIIGSGVGGLGLASLLAQREGEKVLVLEANTVPGGCTHVHERGGFEFNSGLHSVGDMDPRVGRGILRPTADFLTGGQLQWARMPDVHEQASFIDKRYDWYSSKAANLDWLDRDFRGQGDARHYYELEKAVEAGSTGFGAAKALPKWMPESMRELAYSVLGRAWRTYMKRDAWSVLKNELGFSDKLAGVFSYMYGNYGRTPDKVPFSVHAISLYHYHYGAYYPVGGPSMIAETIIPIIERAGGQVAVNTPVERILVEGDRAVGVRLANGTVIRAKKVASDASAWVTFTKLLEPELAAQLGYTQKLKQLGPSPAHIYLFLGYDEALDLPQQIIWRMPRYADIDPYDLKRGDDRYKLEGQLDGVPCYVISPSARDPIWRERRGNTSTVIVLAEAGDGWLDKCNRDPAFKQDLIGRLGEHLKRIAEEEMPQLKGKTPTYMQCDVPVGCNPFALEGCSYGLEPTGPRFVDHAHWLHPQTELKGLYLTGQDTFAPGISGAMFSSRFAYTAMTGDVLSMVLPL